MTTSLLTKGDPAACERLLRYRKVMRGDVDELGLSEPLNEQLKAGTRPLSKDTDILSTVEKKWGNAAKNWVLTGDDAGLDHATIIALSERP